MSLTLPRRGERGFTLIELLVVIVLVAVVATIAVPVISNLIKGANDDANATSAKLEENFRTEYQNFTIDGTTVPGWLIARGPGGNEIARIKDYQAPTGGGNTPVDTLAWFRGLIGNADLNALALAGPDGYPDYPVICYYNYGTGPGDTGLTYYSLSTFADYIRYADAWSYGTGESIIISYEASGPWSAGSETCIATTNALEPSAELLLLRDFHPRLADVMTGTSIPIPYNYTVNDTWSASAPYVVLTKEGVEVTYEYLSLADARSYVAGLLNATTEPISNGMKYTTTQKTVYVYQVTGDIMDKDTAVVPNGFSG